ncbi:MAG: hypothetical protein QHH07_01390 [Sedimentisphaerales bacterium]|jgi:glucosamine-6-phosphate deaminase|nr:hypothetical protein [Sedimentisphaerales bacterium]
MHLLSMEGSHNKPAKHSAGQGPSQPSITSKVERLALEQSAFRFIYRPTEKIGAIVVDNFPMLGKLTALRFLEWVQANPEGVIALPTGKTPEYFIKYTRYVLRTWSRPSTQKELATWGLDHRHRPDMRGLRFVQIDEFYPIDPNQTNSFYYYVRRFYINGLGLDPRKAMLIDGRKIGLRRGERLADVWPNQQVDLSLRYRQPRSYLEQRQQAVLQAVDAWCMEYEDRIRAMGGIGFFLGGIGPDGHIGFNIPGSDHHSTTRLCQVNYPTQAAAAADLGGIETVRRCLVITIGLETITYNPDCVAIIMAAGAAKAKVVATAIQSAVDKRVPASALQKLPNARFYLTGGAASGLMERRLAHLKAQKALEQAQIEKALIDISTSARKPLLALTNQDLRSDHFGRLVLDRTGLPAKALAQKVHRSIVAKIDRGMQVSEDKCFLHTEPHPDDIMLGYFGYVVRHIRRPGNRHYFMTATSGFTSVTNRFLGWHVQNARRFLTTDTFSQLMQEGYFRPDDAMARNRDVWQYLDGIAAANEEMKAEGCARRFIRNLIQLYGSKDRPAMARCLDQLDRYIQTAYPGKKDPKPIQQLKGMCREWEAECLWGYHGWKPGNVFHLRLHFYTGDVFTKAPTWGQDVLPIVRLMERIRPDVVTVAFDPEASGPDTHYKVLQVMAEAIRTYQAQTGRYDLRIWGYRNVWYRFDPSEADIMVPVSLNMFSVVRDAFTNAFLSQKDAFFPSPDYEGPFSDLAQRIQVEQYQTIKCCLGRDWFYHHESPLIRATRGFVFLKEMDCDQFYRSCLRLRRATEGVG